MVESTGGDSQVQKLIDLLGERVFPKRNRWVYYICAAISTMMSFVIVVVYSVVIPLFNYVSLPFYYYVLLLIVVAGLGFEFYLWRKNRYGFARWQIRCTTLLNALVWLVAAIVSILAGSDGTSKIHGCLNVLIACGWFALWCISCYEGDRFMRDNNKSFIELFQSLSEGQKGINLALAEGQHDSTKSLLELFRLLSDSQKLLATNIFPKGVVDEGTPADGADQGAGI